MKKTGPRRSLAIACLCFLMIVLPVSGIGAAQDMDARLLDALVMDASTTLCGEPVPIQSKEVVERFEKEMLLLLGDRSQVILWLKRSARYFPFIESALIRHGLPEDIKYLAIAESALRVHAGSRKGAMGVWQLMPQTARKYGLTVNKDIDERRNPYLSTEAALAYLVDLHARFDSWSLSLAAYNMGEEGLEAQILEQGNRDYYRLYLSLETQRFIFRILAIQKIFKTPQAYGFHLEADDFYSPHVTASVRITAVEDLPIHLIARAAKTDFKTIKDFNPEVRGYYLTSGTRQLAIPTGGREGFQERLANYIKVDKKNHPRRTYVVKSGDSLSGIAKRFEVPLAALLIWNRMNTRTVIHPGQRLVIAPAKEGQADD
ncbi:MAG: lytic transglycosylase [Deltaproteobacteria bacterium]|nr:MAG: lytic transglycosylase [Deltaproteobacteria bacterium]